MQFFLERKLDLTNSFIYLGKGHEASGGRMGTVRFWHSVCKHLVFSHTVLETSQWPLATFNHWGEKVVTNRLPCTYLCHNLCQIIFLHPTLTLISSSVTTLRVLLQYIHKPPLQCSSFFLPSSSLLSIFVQYIHYPFSAWFLILCQTIFTTLAKRFKDFISK